MADLSRRIASLDNARRVVFAVQTNTRLGWMADLLGTLALVYVVELAVTVPSKALAEFCCNYIVVFISIISSSAVSDLPR